MRSPGKITTLEPQQRDPDRLNVYVNDEFILGISLQTAAALNLRIGQAMTPERLEELSRAETHSRAREDAYRLLSYRARSEKEVADRLARRGYEPEVIEATQEHLRQAGFLNDETFARDWAVSRGKTRGRAALAQELRQRGVDRQTAAEALAEAQTPEEEREAARREAVRRVGERPPDRSPQAKARLASALARRGFGWEIIRPLLADLYNSDPEIHTEDIEAEDCDTTRQIPEEYGLPPQYNKNTLSRQPKPVRGGSDD